MPASPEEKAATLANLQAQTEHLRVETAVKRHELEHKDASDKERVYNFGTPIYSETVDTCIEVVQHWINLDPARDITIAFNSPGGIVFEGWALYDFVADHVARGVPIDITAYGKCASMATVCMQAARNRSLHQNCMFMVHEVDSFVHGTTQSLKDQLDFVNSLQDRIEDVLVSRANQEKIKSVWPSATTAKEALHEKTKHLDWWLTAEQTFDYGFIDHIAY